MSNVWSFDTRSKAMKQVTSFKDHDVKTLDASTAANAVVFEQAGLIQELDLESNKARVVPITANGDFPWMMPHWKDVSNRVVALALSPTGKRAAVEARGDIFTIPAGKGDPRNSRIRRVRLIASRHGRPMESGFHGSPTRAAKISSIIWSQDGFDQARHRA